jgi:hypothetical protein
MALDVEQKREISQLMLVAFHYLRRATDAQNYATTKLGHTKDTFPLAGTLDDESRKLTVLGADLASAAIRLASTDEILERAACGRGVYSPCRKYFGPTNIPQRVDLHQHPEWFHILFRDAVGHAEPPDQSPQAKPTLLEHEWRYLDRQNLIEATVFAEAYDRLHKIADELKTHVKKHRIGVPS